MTDAAYAALLELANTPPAWGATVCLAGIYLTLWKAQDKTVRLMLLHGFLAGFLSSLAFWGFDIALMRASEFYQCFEGA